MTQDEKDRLIATEKAILDTIAPDQLLAQRARLHAIRRIAVEPAPEKIEIRYRVGEAPAPRKTLFERMVKGEGHSELYADIAASEAESDPDAAAKIVYEAMEDYWRATTGAPRRFWEADTGGARAIARHAATKIAALGRPAPAAKPTTIRYRDGSILVRAPGWSILMRATDDPSIAGLDIVDETRA
jgi:hypothetical protein